MAGSAARFRVDRDGRLRHGITAATVDNDLAGWIAEDLVGTGLVDAAEFERVFESVVVSVAPDPDEAWLAFYRNTLAALAAGGAPGGTNAGMAPVHERAAALAVGSVVELGCCFGFLSLRLAGGGHRVTAMDLTVGTVQLLGRTAPALGLAVAAVAGDATAVPLADGCADTVFAMHLLEHLRRDATPSCSRRWCGWPAGASWWRCPTRRSRTPTWGHVRTFDAADLHELGAATGRRYDVTDHHGGWLVIEP